jgi:hypothetical protein
MSINQPKIRKSGNLEKDDPSEAMKTKKNNNMKIADSV